LEQEQASIVVLRRLLLGQSSLLHQTDEQQRRIFSPLVSNSHNGKLGTCPDVRLGTGTSLYRRFMKIVASTDFPPAPDFSPLVSNSHDG
jgi:hypothetical protein